MGIDVTVNVTIARPVGDVAAYAMDPSNDPAWIGGISEAALESSPPLGPDAQVRRVAHFLGKRIDYVTEVIEHDPPRRLHMRTVSGPFPMQVTYTFEDEDGGTIMRIRNRGDATGFFRLATPLLAAMVRRSVKRDLESLKSPMERLGHRSD